MMQGSLMLRRAPAVIVRYLPVVLLMLLPVVLGSRFITDGTLRYSDETTHAMDGVFVRDSVADLPQSIADPFAMPQNIMPTAPLSAFLFTIPLL